MFTSILGLMQQVEYDSTLGMHLLVPGILAFMSIPYFVFRVSTHTGLSAKQGHSAFMADAGVHHIFRHHGFLRCTNTVFRLHRFNRLVPRHPRCRHVFSASQFRQPAHA